MSKGLTPTITAMRHSRKGQASVFIALLLFVLVLFLAMATNIGIVINDRIRMQNTVDMATYTVAYNEAQVLNELVEINREIADIVAYCRTVLTSTVWATCIPDEPDPVAEVFILSCKEMLDVQIDRFVAKAEWQSAVGNALDAGKETAERNFAGTRALTSFMDGIFGSPTFPGTYTLDYSYNVWGLSFPLPSIANLQQAQVTLNYTRLPGVPGPDGCNYEPPIYPENDVYAWFYKATDEPEIWVEGRVKGTPRKQLLDFAYSSGGGDGGYFGASSTGGDDTIWAYAVAKPFEGSIGPTRASDGDRNGEWMAGPLYVPGAAASVYTQASVLGMVDEYRARLAGITDNLAGSALPTWLAEIDGSWDSSLFTH